VGAVIREVTTEGNDIDSLWLDLPVESMNPGIYLLEIETTQGRRAV
jgi:hypothetical protein